MATEEILPGVWQVGMGYVNAFLVAREDGVTLIDSGLPGKRRAILKALRQAGRAR
jgi:glyoxylase-like metal-dependent hydrolase (beta-lactamase superfamily II)